MTGNPDPPAHKKDQALMLALARRYGLEGRVAPTVDDLLLLVARVERLEKELGLDPIESIEDVFRGGP